MVAVWFKSGTEQPTTMMFFPTKPQLFTFRRRSQPVDSPAPNGAADTASIANGSIPDASAGSSRVDHVKTEELISVQTVLETRVPSLFKSFKPSWWLPNGHTQTGYVVAGDFTKVDQITYERYEFMIFFPFFYD